MVSTTVEPTYTAHPHETVEVNGDYLLEVMSVEYEPGPGASGVHPFRRVYGCHLCSSGALATWIFRSRAAKRFRHDVQRMESSEIHVVEEPFTTLP
ncbi:MAG: hypothetical protein E4H09_03970 [Spirochaetales bacterium]|nr:MAG: hypothetical protein E4H09_03970 [Spirochaetales bacterium]